MEIPATYTDREQTWLKHEILRGYLQSWAMKLGSVARTLWYVDCFAGPWEARAENLEDTSVAIGLHALNEAADFWTARGKQIRVRAVFVEAKPASFARLQEYVGENAGVVEATTLQGHFVERVPDIQGLLGRDPAFIFVDPTGWKGVAMRGTAPLVRVARRDVMVNVMFDHINRFKDAPLDFIRDQLRDFFGLEGADIPAGLDEEGLMRLYRQQLREHGGLRYLADIAVPVPTVDRTYFRLVVGGHDKEVLRLFRDEEARVAGRRAATVRAQAKARDMEQRTGQVGLFGGHSAPEDKPYATRRDADLSTIRRLLPKLIGRSGGRVRFAALWSEILQEHHVTCINLSDCIRELEGEHRVVVHRENPRARALKDGDIIELALPVPVERG
ncbi:MAG: three-Cys-motif partner protein TcmP [Pseudomonadota bacterium]